jgi:hypothetical protein
VTPPGFEKRTSLSDARESVRNSALRERGEWWERFAPFVGPLAALLLLVFTGVLLFWLRRDQPRRPPAVATTAPAFPEPARIAPAPVTDLPAAAPRGSRPAGAPPRGPRGAARRRGRRGCARLGGRHPRLWRVA